LKLSLPNEQTQHWTLDDDDWWVHRSTW
jgi:hypothetical protein